MKRTVPIAKSLDEEKRLALYVVLEPDVFDSQDHTYSKDEVQKGCWNFNLFCGQANLFHMIPTEEFTIVESYTAPVEMSVNGTVVKQGTWLALCKFHNDLLWEDVKQGKFSGLSISCFASVEELPEDESENQDE